MRKILNITGITIMLALIAVLVIINAPRLAGTSPFVVLSDSMEPKIKVGSLIYAKSVNPEEVEVGDVITFRLSSTGDIVVAHRVIEKDEATKSFITKGDANETQDLGSVTYAETEGKVMLTIPVMGYVYEFMHTAMGIVVTVLLFAAAIAMWITAEFLKRKENPKRRYE